MGYYTFEITSQNFQQEVMDSALPVLVEFGAEWCPPCKMISPILDDMAQQHQASLRIGTLDVDANPDLQMQFGVMSLPTLLLFQEGQVTKKIVGFQSKPRLEAAILPSLATETAQ